MVRILSKAFIIAIVRASAASPSRPRQASLPLVRRRRHARRRPRRLGDPRARAQGAPLPLLARFVLPGHGAARARAPSRSTSSTRSRPRAATSPRTPAPARTSCSSSRSPEAQTATTVFAAFCAILLLPLTVPPEPLVGRRRQGARRPAHPRPDGGLLASTSACSPRRSGARCSRSRRCPSGSTSFWRLRRGLEPALPAGLAQRRPGRLARHRGRPGQRCADEKRRRAAARRSEPPARRARPTGRGPRAGTARTPAGARDRRGARGARGRRARRRLLRLGTGERGQLGCARSADAFASISPSRRATRCTWVSTGITGRSRAKSRTQAAVLGPIPGSARRGRPAPRRRSCASSSRRGRARRVALAHRLEDRP